MLVIDKMMLKIYNLNFIFFFCYDEINFFFLKYIDIILDYGFSKISK